MWLGRFWTYHDAPQRVSIDSEPVWGWYDQPVRPGIGPVHGPVGVTEMTNITSAYSKAFEQLVDGVIVANVGVVLAGQLVNGHETLFETARYAIWHLS